MSETFDFVVVGSGGGSMCAALALRAAGRSVLILEKAPLVGGTTAISGGVMWIPANRFMREAGIEDSAEKALAYLDTVVGDHPDTPGASRARRRAYVEQAPRMIDFLVEQGIRLRRLPSWPDYYNASGESVPGRTVVSELWDIKQLGAWKDKLRPGFLPLPANLDEAMQLPLMKRSGAAKKVLLRVIGRALADRLSGRRRATAGQALQGQMLHAALKAGVEIRTDSPVKRLLLENGRVTGVLTDAGEVRARLGVLLNAGGFARNQRMRDQYIPGTSAEWTNVIAEDTGEMIEEGLRLGAAVAQMEERVGSPMALPPENPKIKPGMQGDLAKPHAILVDQGGARYLRESSSYVQICQQMLARNKVSPAVPSWMVFDQRHVDTYMLAGSMPGRAPKAWREQGFLRSGESVEALAAACGIAPARLRATVDRYNGFVRQGRDEDFGRGDHAYGQWLGDPLAEGPAKTLGTLEQGPFHAVQVYPGDVSTFGGLVTDEHARVLRANGTAIEGLYATGTTTASVMGRDSPGAGASIGPSFTWGYVAARHALNQR